MALESVWEVTLLEILTFFTFDLVRVPGFGMAPQTTFDLFFSCFSKCEAMEHYESQYATCSSSTPEFTFPLATRTQLYSPTSKGRQARLISE